MGVLDIYGFEIFEVRQKADQTLSKPPGHFITFEKENEKDFAPGCLRASFGACEELINKS